MRRSGAPALLAVVGLAAGCTHPTAPSPSSSPPGVVSPTRPGPAVAQPAACAHGRGTLSEAAELGPGAPLRTIVYLPPCYATSGPRRYPTLILLHGGGADETQWPDIGLATTADRLINQGRIPPFIAVTPRTGGPSTRAVEAFVLNELLPWMDEQLRTRTASRDRKIGGISLGGASALRIAGDHPGLFGAVGGHSPAVKPSDRDLAASLADRGPEVWLDVGQDDSLRPAVEDLAANWRINHVAVELRVSQGRHDRAYWRSQMESYLLFYANGWN